MIKSFNQLIDAAIEKEPQRVAVAVAEDEEVLAAVKEALELGIADFTLVGNSEKIKTLAQEVGLDLASVELIDEHNNVSAARAAVAQVSSGKANLVMKGLVSTSVLLKAVLDKEIGLRTGLLLSHVAILEAKKQGKLILMSDGGMNISPDVEQKAQIIRNAVYVAQKALKIEKPLVAPLAAVEKMNPTMQATVDAAILSKMNDRGQIKDCIVDGPLNLNGAISLQAAEHIGLESPVAGNADILLVPYIEVGNVLYKSMVYFAGAQVAGVVVGAKAPIILTSRADSHQAKVNSIAASVLLA